MRIVSLVPSITETLYILGIGNQIEGVTRYCILPKEAKEKEQVGGTKDPDLQKIVDMKPDIVVMDRDENLAEHAEFLRDSHIPLFVVHVRSIDDVEQMITEIGEHFDVRDGAETMRQQIHELASKQQHTHQRTLTLIWRNPYMTMNDDTYVSAICRHFGLENAFGTHAERYPELTDDDIRRADPEVVLLPDEPYPFQQRHVEEFRELFPEVHAVRKSRLIQLNGAYLTWHGYGTLRALREMPAVLDKTMKTQRARRITKRISDEKV